MACLEMYNQNPDQHHKGMSNPPPMSPRISFSNDFLESSSHSQSHLRLGQSHMRPAAAYRDAPVSSDFEFSVSNHSMMSADELFFKGRLLPFKENCGGGNKTTTLRDEIQIEENDEDFSLRPPKNPTRWKGFLGLKKSHVGSKKSSDKAEVSVEKTLGLHEDEQCS
ncbi:uncharacterized protein LOC142550293 [Primulina tabacum]|uniref:uncharacterized protein LOC142550293 n=1 Tax=Primulina tabacum TaxID=48773 RepID=UPI003F5A2E29